MHPSSPPPSRHLTLLPQTWPGQRIFQTTWLGPDWTLEPYRALTALYQWRTAVQHRVPSSGFDRPIVLVMSTMPAIFNGFGLRSACDALFAAGIWPLMPTWALCGLHATSSGTPASAADVLFAHFAEVLRGYSAQWAAPGFLAGCAIGLNAKNPLAYHKTATEHFHNSYINVFQKRTVLVPSTLWVEYVNRGLLDGDHTIGAYTYASVAHKLLSSGHRRSLRKSSQTRPAQAVQVPPRPGAQGRRHHSLHSDPGPPASRVEHPAPHIRASPHRSPHAPN